MAGALMAAVPGVANAETSELDQMRAEMAQMRAEMAQLKADQQGDWMSDTRRAEIEGMIADVFADANSRATLLQEGAMAGIDEKGKIFLMSADGSFSANFHGQLQFRYIWNSVDDRVDESVSGFQMRRTKFGVKGKVGDGWGYYLKFEANRDGGDVSVADAYATYKVNDKLSLNMGVKKLPFARQELISSSRQVAVERSLATEFFTVGRSDLIEAIYKVNDNVVVTGAISDGGNQNYTDWNADTSNDFAVTGRVDWMAMGDDWSAAKHEFGGVDEDALFVGAAVHYETADGIGTGVNPAAVENSLFWTVDALYKTGALGLTAAIFGNSTEGVVAGTDLDQLGFYAQASYDLGNDWDVFGRYDYIDGDAAGAEELQAVTFGVNHHFNKNVKFTGDVVYVFSGDDPAGAGSAPTDGEGSDALGLVGNTDGDDQIALRLQLQLLF
jgi:phosphate-selective porin OprO/OprP